MKKGLMAFFCYNKIKKVTRPFYSIGKTGFEPATPWSQTKYSTKLSYFPNLSYSLNAP